LRLGIPQESSPGERRVAATPESVRKLVALRHEVSVQSGAGLAAGHDDDAYRSAGAAVASADEVWGSDVVMKVRPPSLDEVPRLREGAVLISLLQPERHPGLLDALAARKVTALALERIPRVSRAQKMDVLSSTANLAGYRAVIEAAAHFGGFFGPQITAAGKSPPARVLIIGAGVAGLAAIGAARALGAEVRAFDTRAAAEEQVRSLGATFLTVTVTEDGDGGGGYAKEMSQAFIDAEMALFRAQAAEVDVIITTALVPGKKAPTLLPEDVVDALRPGSVVVDMAAEQGGNCALTVPGENIERRGVKILGCTDLVSRMAPTASQFLATNLVNLLNEMGGEHFTVDLDNDVIRPALALHRGEALPPLPPKPASPTEAKAPAKPAAPKPPPAAPPAAKEVARPKHAHLAAPPPQGRAWGTLASIVVAVAVLGLAGRFAPPAFLQHLTVFVLACFVGWQVIWSVTPALHTPLMSVTNAISGIIIVGGMLQIGPQGDGLATWLGALAVLLAAINVAGGFLVTERMLKMFRREGENS
jgi:NAD(P) transhydrogenase subunit alpha